MRLARFVHVDGTWYPKGSEPPLRVAAAITNSKAWATEESPAPVGDTPQPEQGTPPDPEAPVRPGKAGYVADWRAYVAQVSDLDEDTIAGMTKDECVRFVEQLERRAAETAHGDGGVPEDTSE